MLILGRKTSKIAVFEKMLILGRRTCQTRFFTKKSKFKKLTLKFSFQGIKCKKGFIFESIFSKRALQIVYIGKPMQISLVKLILWRKTNANFTNKAHFILENQCKIQLFDQFYTSKIHFVELFLKKIDSKMKPFLHFMPQNDKFIDNFLNLDFFVKKRV